MNNLIELLFEGIAKNKLDSFVGRLPNESTLKSVSASEIPDLDLRSWHGRVLEILERTGPDSSSTSLTLDRVEFGGVTVVNPLIQVLMDDGNIDVSLSFLDSELRCSTSDCVHALHCASLELSRVVGARHVICGYEPAKDHETRFFTDAIQGPLRGLW